MNGGKAFVRKEKAIVLGLALWAFALYAFRLATPSLRGDEAFTALVSSWSLPKIVHALRTIEPHPPLYYVLMHIWIACLGRSEWAIRFPSLVSGVLLVPFTYALGRQWRHPRAGVWGAALVTINPFLLWHAQDARMYSLLAVFGLGSLVLALKMLDRIETKYRGAELGYIAATLGALATHYYALLLLAAENVVFLVSLIQPLHRRRRMWRWLRAQGILLLAIGAWSAYAGRFMMGHSKDWIPATSLPALAWRSFAAFSLGNTLQTPYAWPGLAVFGGLFVIGLLASAMRLRSTEDRQQILLSTTMLWATLALPMIVTSLLSLWRPVFDERYLIFIVPIHLLLAAYGLGWLASQWRAASIALFAFLALVSGCAVYRYHYLPQYAKSPDWRGVMDHMAALKQPEDVLILNYPDPAQEYYNAGRIPYVLLPASFPVDIAATAASLEHLNESQERIWLVPVRADNWDREGIVEHWLGRYADAVEKQTFPGLHLQLYHTPQRYLQTMHPVGAELSGQVRLLGYDLQADGQAVSPDQIISPGTILRLKLYWQALSQMQVDYTVFTHLLDVHGVMRGQKDNPPLQGTYPTTKWQPGERLIDAYDIFVDQTAPAGEHILEIGMYEWPANKRLPVTDSQGNPLGDHLILTKVQVGP